MANEIDYERDLFAHRLDKTRPKEKNHAFSDEAGVLRPIAAELNNVAVDLCRSGKLSSGIRLFGEALRTTTAIAQCMVEEESCMELAVLVEKIECAKQEVEDIGLRKQCVELDMFDIPATLQTSSTWFPDMVKIDNITESDRRAAAKVLFNIGLAHVEQGSYIRAADLFEFAKDALKDSMDSNDLLALVLNSMGCLQCMQNNLDSAYQSFQQAYNIASKELQATNYAQLQQCLGNISSNLGRIFLLRKNYSEALSHCFNALQSKRSSLGEEHVEVCAVMYNIGFILHLQERHNEALDFYQNFFDRAFATNCQDLIPSKYKVTVLIQVLLIHCEKFSFSCKSYEFSVVLKRLRSLRSSLGTDHPSIPRILNNIGLFLIEFSLNQFAIPFFIEQLRIEKRILGQKNQILTTTLNVIGQAYQQQQNYHDALAYFEQALSLLQEHRNNDDIDHSIYALTLYNIGINQYQTGYYHESLTNLQRAIQHQKLALGEYHPEVANMLSITASIQLELGRVDHAMNSMMEALLVTRRHYGNSHVLTAKLLYKIAEIHDFQGNFHQALDVYYETLSVEKLSHGEYTLDVAMTLKAIAQLQHTIGYLDQAIDTFKQLLSVLQAILKGPSQPKVRVLKMLAALYNEKGLISESNKIQEQATAMERACPNQQQVSEVEIKLLAMLCDVSCVLPAAASAA